MAPYTGDEWPLCTAVQVSSVCVVHESVRVLFSGTFGAAINCRTEFVRIYLEVVE